MVTAACNEAHAVRWDDCASSSMLPSKSYDAATKFECPDISRLAAVHTCKTPICPADCRIRAQCPSCDVARGGNGKMTASTVLSQHTTKSRSDGSLLPSW